MQKPTRSQHARAATLTASHLTSIHTPIPQTHAHTPSARTHYPDTHKPSAESSPPPPTHPYQTHASTTHAVPQAQAHTLCPQTHLDACTPNTLPHKTRVRHPQATGRPALTPSTRRPAFTATEAQTRTQSSQKTLTRRHKNRGARQTQAQLTDPSPGGDIREISGVTVQEAPPHLALLSPPGAPGPEERPALG